MDFIFWWCAGSVFTSAYADRPESGMEAFIQGAFWPYFVGKQVRADVQNLQRIIHKQGNP